MENKQPLERITILISNSERQQLEKLAADRDMSLSAMSRRAIQAFLYAMRHKDKKKVRMKSD